MMIAFKGFPEGKTRLTPVPGPFFTDLLPEIDHLGELKVTLYVFWQLDRREGVFRFLREADFTADERLMKGLGQNQREAEAVLQDALERATGRGTLLAVTIISAGVEETLYFLNSPRGRAAVEAIRSGKWTPTGDRQAPLELSLERPNIFRLFEENIGPLTPMIAETLRDAEADYPAAWIEDAIRIAVERNARNWRFVEAVLKRWQQEGRDEQDRGNSEKDRRRYIEGEFSEYIDH